MPRRGPITKRETAPDPVYQNVYVHKLINRMMLDGKKSLAMRLVYGAFDRIRERTGKPPVEVFDAALKNVMPVLEVRPRRVGGANYLVPVEVNPHRRVSLGIRWIVLAARDREGRSMVDKLAAEILDAAQGTGGAVKKREEMHRMAEANRAFAHYRW